MHIWYIYIYTLHSLIPLRNYFYLGNCKLEQATRSDVNCWEYVGNHLVLVLLHTDAQLQEVFEFLEELNHQSTMH